MNRILNFTKQPTSCLCKIGFSIFAVVAVVASPCSAQTRTTVTLSSGHGCNNSAQPTFDALSLASTITAPDLSFGGSGVRTFSDIVLTKTFDDCSISMYSLLFTGAHVQTVVISFLNSASAGGKAKETEALRITLTGSVITSIADSEGATAGFGERVTLSYERIEILDPGTGARVAYDRATGRSL